MTKIGVVMVMCAALSWTLGCSSSQKTEGPVAQPYAYAPGYAQPVYPPSAPQSVVVAAGVTAPAEAQSERRFGHVPCWRCREMVYASTPPGVNCRFCGAINWIP